MKFTFLKTNFLAALVCIALGSAVVWLLLQDADVSQFHPASGTLWQAYYWVADTCAGHFGLEEWRLEGVNEETAIYLGKWEYYDIPLSAPTTAALLFASGNAVGLFCFAGFNLLFCKRQIRINAAHEKANTV